MSKCLAVLVAATILCEGTVAVRLGSWAGLPDMAECTDAEQTAAATCDGQLLQLPGYYIEFPSNLANVGRLKCQLAKTFCPLQAEDAVVSTAEDLARWKRDGLVAERNNLVKPWQADRQKYEVKYASVFMNHMHTWQKHVDTAHDEWAGVFEGDAVFRADFHERVAELIPKLKAADLGADIVYLGHCFDEDCSSSEKMSFMLGAGTRVVESTSPMCSHAYLVSRRGAQLLLDHSTPIVENNDIAPMESLIKEGVLKSLTVCPMVSRQDWESFEYPYDAYYHPTLYWVSGALGVLAAVALTTWYLKTRPSGRKSKLDQKLSSA